MATSSSSPVRKATRKRNPAVKVKAKASGRINFTSTVAREIAFEAHLFCSKPDCCRFTSFSSTAGKARAIAEAAHVAAASPGGPRANSGLKPVQVKSAANGLWLCKVCHDLIDADPQAFPEAMLFDWKANHAIFVRQLVGKHFDVAHFEVFARSRNTAECFAFLAFIENRRVFFEALDTEHPEQVLESLVDVRTRISQSVGHLLAEEPAVHSMKKMRSAILKFLSANPTLQSLKSCNGDPIYHQFREGLEQLRKELLPHVLAIAASVDYPLSSDIRAEAARLNATLQP